MAANGEVTRPATAPLGADGRVHRRGSVAISRCSEPPPSSASPLVPTNADLGRGGAASGNRPHHHYMVGNHRSRAGAEVEKGHRKKQERQRWVWIRREGGVGGVVKRELALTGGVLV
jgi:hypothetical protein